MEYKKEIHKPTSEELEDIFTKNELQKKIDEIVEYTTDNFDKLVLEQLAPYGITKENFLENKDRLTCVHHNGCDGDTFYWFALDHEPIFTIRCYATVNIPDDNYGMPVLTYCLKASSLKEDSDNV